jgi:short-subunit dehydrogenase
MKDPRSILITGGSSGIGEALALAYASPGVSLALTGRDAGRLGAVATACRARGASIETALIDVADGDAMERWIATIDRATPIDLVIANAGRGGGGTKGNALHTNEQMRGVFAVNVNGVLNTVLPLIPKFVERRRGQIALISSLVSFRGVPGSTGYSASKAAVRMWGEGLRGDLHCFGVEVSVVCPGFVRSRMTAKKKFRMPLLLTAERAAEIIKQGLERNRGRIAFPLPLYLLAWFLGGLPPLLTDPLFRRAAKKR